MVIDKTPILPRADEGIHIENRTFFISADLGQTTDYTAISIIERIVKGDGILGPNCDGERSFHLRHIERPPRGTEYPAIVDRLIQLFNAPHMKEYPKAVVIDLTGVGRPVYDLMRRSGFYYSLNAITITGGDVVTAPGHYQYGVPKRDLITNLQVMLQNGELRIAKGMKLADALTDEMMNFQVKITASGHDIYGARSGAHDDIVLSVAMGAWLARRVRCYGDMDM